MDGSEVPGQVFEFKMDDVSSEKEVKKWWRIDREMIRFKLHFFFFLGGLGTISPFTPVFVKNHLRLSATLYSSAILLFQIPQLLTKPAVALVVDYFNRLKATLCILVLCKVALYFAFFSLPTIPHSCDQQVCESITYHNSSPGNLEVSISNSSDVDFQQCRTFVNKYNVLISCQRKYNSKTLNDTPVLSSSCEACYHPLCEPCCGPLDCLTKDTRTDLGSYQFWLFAAVLISMFVVIDSLYVLSETACCEGVVKKGADYGRQRLFGPIGWGIMSFVGGVLSDSTNGYLAACAVLGAMSFALLLNITYVDLSKPTISRGFFRTVRDDIFSRDFVAFQIGTFVSGIGFGINWYYLIWYLNSLGGSNTLFGLVHTVQNCGELLFMFISDWLIRKMGYFHITSLSLFSYGVRFLFLSSLRNPWYSLLMEWTHGISYGIYYVALVSFAKKTSKPGTEATTQSVLFLTFVNFGKSVGNILAGVSIDYLGEQLTFFYSGLFFGLFSLISLGYSLLFVRQIS